jgi:hypothetical protein
MCLSRHTLFAKNTEDVEVSLGTKRIILGNAASRLPFGTIDTRTQGEFASGTIVNFGWALTPQPNQIPLDGSRRISVVVDVAVRGHPVYNNLPSDVANLPRPS